MKKSKIKSVVFLSNYLTHHQQPFSDAMYSKLGTGYVFVETDRMPDSQKKLGYSDANKPAYVKYYTDPDCQDLVDQADVVIWGSAPIKLIYNRKRACKLTFRYSERIYKAKLQIYKLPRYFYSFHKIPKSHKNSYLLCASAYASADYAKALAFVNKAFKWGYFPETKRYHDLDEMVASKDSRKILWCGRFLDWKHPDDMIALAERLKQDGYDFQIDLVGTGDMEDQLQTMIAEKGLSNQVQMLGSMPPGSVRSHMEKAAIYLFTSDRHEGWGAVLNESMNSACAVVASHAIGAVPYLIENEKNGLIYRDGDLEDMYQKVKYLLDHPDRRVELSKNAYSTIVDEWNAENAAEKFLALSEELIDSPKAVFSTEKGVCSKAELLSDNWFIRRNKKCSKK